MGYINKLKSEYSSSLKMVKKTYIPVSSNGKNYKIFMEDIAKVHSIAKSARPRVPSYNETESALKF